ncbi:MAG TPA: hypothetical protein VMR45_05335 [Patescibacteria group bacterium]|nr:hypothetical protein [Patescibacteria group bacterium]
MHQAVKKVKRADELQLRYNSRVPGTLSGSDLKLAVIGLEGVFTTGVAATADDLVAGYGVDINQGLSEAIKGFVKAKVAELPAAAYELDVNSQSYRDFVEAAQAVDVDAALQAVEVRGDLDSLPFPISETYLKIFLANTIPGVAIQDIRRIVFRALTKAEADNGDDKIHTLGFNSYSKTLDGTVIVISTDVINRIYDEYLQVLTSQGYSDVPLRAALATLDRTLRTIAHETGHVLNGLVPVAALQRWEEVCAQDPTNVTEYIKRRNDENHPDRYMEAFADPSALYIRSPGELTVTSKARFEAMDQLFSEVHHDYASFRARLQASIDLSRKIRQAEGMTDEEYRKDCLYFENDTVSVGAIAESLRSVVDNIDRGAAIDELSIFNALRSVYESITGSSHGAKITEALGIVAMHISQAQQSLQIARSSILEYGETIGAEIVQGDPEFI